LVILCITVSLLEEKFNKGWGNSSSKAFSVSAADRPKAKTIKLVEMHFYQVRRIFFFIIIIIIIIITIFSERFKFRQFLTTLTFF
jgi:hypothetical protein